MSMSEVCPTNLGPRQTSRRLVSGLVLVALGLGGAIAAVALDLPPWMRLLVLGPLGLGTLSLIQARAKT